jgi:hypothetical protein
MNSSPNKAIQAKPISENMLDILNKGGILRLLKDAQSIRKEDAPRI